MPSIGLIGGSYTLEALNAECQRAVNLYAETIESGKGKNVGWLNKTPGLSTFCTLGGMSVTGLFTQNGRLWGLSGAKLYEILSDGTTIERGAVATDTNIASFAGSATQILIVSAGNAYIYDFVGNGPITNITPLLLGTPSKGGYVDGYFTISLTPSQRFQISGILDGLTWDATDIAQVSLFPDDVLSTLTDHRELWLFGRTRTMAYYNSGNPDFPFDPIPGAYIEQGIIAPDSPSKLDNSIFWLGGDERGAAVAWRAQGYTPSRISTHATEFAWQSYTRVDDAIGYSYQDKGHAFWMLSFPSANTTWCFDVSTGLWHERGYWNIPTGSYQRHRSQCHAYCFGKHLVGDWKSGKVYQMSTSLYDDSGEPIRWLRRAPHITKGNGMPLFFNRLSLDFETGLGLQEGQGSDPQAMLRISTDGARTWGSEMWRSIGAVGKYSQQVIWRRLGMTRKSVVFELSGSDPTPVRIANDDLEVSE